MKRLKFVLICLIAAALGACGGGGDMVARIGGGGSGSPPPPTNEFGVGGVGGFGSIIINGQHYDETAGVFQVDERPDQPAAISVDAIRLGMQMQFESASNRISKGTIGAEVIGPVASLTASSLVVLGQTVRINADPALPTVFDGFVALTDLTTGSIVEVHDPGLSERRCLWQAPRGRHSRAAARHCAHCRVGRRPCAIRYQYGGEPGA